MRTPQTCKYCEHKTNPEKCPHFMRKNGQMPDNGRCKKFKKRKINDDDYLRDCVVEAKSVEDFLKRYHVRDRLYREEFDLLVKSDKEAVEKYGHTVLPAHISVTGNMVAYFPKKQPPAHFTGK